MLVALSHLNLTSLLFLNFHLGKPFLLIDDLVLHFVLCLQLELMVSNLLLVLRLLDFGLLGFFKLAQVDSLLHLFLLFSPLLLDHVVLRRLVTLHLLFLKELPFFLNTINLAVPV